MIVTSHMSGRLILGICCVVALTSAATVYAAAYRQPGIRLNIEVASTLAAFPDSYKDLVPAVYAAYLSFINLPQEEKAIRDDVRAKYNDIEAKPWKADKKSEEQKKLQQEEKAALQALDQRKVELRNAFLFLADDYLLDNDDPYVLFIAAEEFYAIRGDAPMHRAARPVDDTPVIRLEDKKTVRSSALEQGAKAASAEEAAEAKAEETKAEETEAKQYFKEYRNHHERVIDYCARVIASFKNFEYLAETYYLMGVALQESGRQVEAMTNFKTFMDRWPTSRLYQEVLFRYSELMFDSTRVFDHFDQAYELYGRVVKLSAKKDQWYFRGMYKQGWSAFLSMNFTEDAKGIFTRLYSELDAIGEEKLNTEQQSIMAESKHLLIQFKQGKPDSYEFFRR